MFGIKVRAGMISTFFLLMMSSSAIAQCTKITAQSQLSSTNDGVGALWYGSLHYNNGSLGLPSVVDISTSNDFQPDGTLLASSVAPFTSYAVNSGYVSEQVLFRCDAADAGKVYEVYATNGDAVYAGMYDDGSITGVAPKAYATYVRNIAIRFTNMETGEFYDKIWKSRPLTGLDTDSQGRLLVKAKNFSAVQTEIFRLNYARSGTNNAASYLYAYTQPNAYIAFRGPGITGPADGADSQTSFPGWYGTWPASIGLYNYVTFRRGATCKVSNFTPVVTLPAINISALQAGEVSQSPFTLDFQCQSAATSGLKTGQIALGFLAPPASVAAATKYGLITSGAANYLLDEQYGAAGHARGVGVKIYRSNQPMQFLTTDTTKTTGWSPILGGDQTLVDSNTAQGINSYTETFMAQLEKFGGDELTAGSYQAHAQILIRIQ